MHSKDSSSPISRKPWGLYLAGLSILSIAGIVAIVIIVSKEQNQRPSVLVEKFVPGQIERPDLRASLDSPEKMMEGSEEPASTTAEVQLPPDSDPQWKQEPVVLQQGPVPMPAFVQRFQSLSHPEVADPQSATNQAVRRELRASAMRLAARDRQRANP